MVSKFSPLCNEKIGFCPLRGDTLQKRNSPGFTIVELLVVIVVIGILAAIIIVSYTGMSSKAVLASIQSDLSNASTQLKMFQAVNGTYPATISTDCVAQPDTITNKCLKISSGNTYTYYQSDNYSSPQVFSLYASNSSDTTNYRITDNSRPLVSDDDYASCLAIYSAGYSTGNGIYWIKPASTKIAVYCDMINSGWTRLNNNIASSTTLFNSNDVILTNNVSGNCGTPGCAFTVSGISVTHTNVRIYLTRTTSIAQCTALSGVTTTRQYWNGAGWTSNAMCNWSDGIFANASATDMAGLKLLWKLEGAKATNGEIKYISECSGGTDSGQIQVTAWVK